MRFSSEDILGQDFQIIAHEIAVVSQKSAVRLIISSLLGFDARDNRDRLDQLPANLNILDFKDYVGAMLTAP